MNCIKAFFQFRSLDLGVLLWAFCLHVDVDVGSAAEQSPNREVLPKPGIYKSLTEPPCSYCSTQDRKGFIRSEDRVVAWLRAAHNGGAIPIRLFLTAPRVINDTYGLFFYDADGDYVSAFPKARGY